MELSMIFYFLGASVLLTLAPGPDNMYLLSKSLADGPRAGIALTGGLMSGIVFHTMLVIVGVAALIRDSAVAFALLKYLGAAYLLFLAWKAFREKGDLRLGHAGTRESCPALYRRGLLMNVLNPKVLLFFLAFLPQFVDMRAESVGLQIAFLGFLFALQGFFIFSGIAICAGKVRKFILRVKNIHRILCVAQGLVLTVIAAALLFG